MFEKELDRERKALRSYLTVKEPYVTLKAILANEEVHRSYRTFFEAEVAWWVHEERAIRISNPRFETADNGFKDLSRKMDSAYSQTARFDHEELNATIEAAVKTRLNYLCRPRTTLKWFVYRGEPTKPIHEVLLRLGYLHDYRYLTDGIRNWAKSRRNEVESSYEILSIIEFERIVEKVDNDSILDLSQGEFVRMLDPMYEYFAAAMPELPPETVPTEAVIIFLDDKGAIPISQALERLLYREELKFLTRTRFLDVIDSVIAEIEAGNEQPYITREADPIKRLQEQVEQHIEVQAGRHEVVNSENVNDYRRLKFADLVDSTQRERFIEKLFSGNEKVMDDVLKEVLACTQWKDAMASLDRWYARNDVEPNGAIAMEFAHTLNRAFR